MSTVTDEGPDETQFHLTPCDGHGRPPAPEKKGGLNHTRPALHRCAAARIAHNQSRHSRTRYDSEHGILREKKFEKLVACDSFARNVVTLFNQSRVEHIVMSSRDNRRLRSLGA